MRRLVSLGLATAVLGLGACGGTRHTAPWQRTTLWTATPTLEERPYGGRYAHLPFYRPLITFLGAAEVRDMALVPAKQLIAFPARPAGQVEALETVLGARLSWKATLGEQAYLSFTPLGCTAPCSFRAAVRAADGALTELHQSARGTVPTFAPAAIEIDLARWRGQTVDIVLEARGEVASGTLPDQWPRALWVDPVLYSRLPDDRAAESAARAARPNVLLIGVDTLRADAVGPRPASAFQAARPSLTPSIDRLASESDVYADAYSVFNVTNPSFASIFTGLYGKNHGIYDLATPLAPAQRTLAQIFADAGYDTFAVISARHLGDHNSGLGRGFKDRRRGRRASRGRDGGGQGVGLPRARAVAVLRLGPSLRSPHSAHAAAAVRRRRTADGGERRRTRRRLDAVSRTRAARLRRAGARRTERPLRRRGRLRRP
jgi:hypothetical protein